MHFVSFSYRRKDRLFVDWHHDDGIHALHYEIFDVCELLLRCAVRIGDDESFVRMLLHDVRDCVDQLDRVVVAHEMHRQSNGL